MYFRSLVLTLLVSLVLGCETSPVKPEPPDNSLQKILELYKDKYQLPALAGGVIENQQVKIYTGGVRKNNSTDPVNESDYFFIGSNIKAMTATMLATLVKEKLLTWNSTITSIFPELNGVIPPAYGHVTLTQLLNHHGGIKPFELIEELFLVPSFTGSISEQRYEFTKWVLKKSDKTTIGAMHYSNAGYVIAAAMAEKVTGQSWEELMTNRLLNPLGMRFYFDWPAEAGRNEPWGHTFANVKYVPYNPDSSLQFPQLFNPAGNISLRMTDYLKFIQLHIDGLNGRGNFLDKSTFEILHTPVDNYSLGWIDAVDPDTGIPVAFHEGSDGTFDAFVILKPTLQKGAAVFTNCYSDSASEAIVMACIELMK